ncbi:hypothetical protein L596_007276 [Steinernema carpocapsae]|uniref:PINIT domain-containing protein n=1 Tax=Steinernema carpocapsae TaxID=34508 RepID=A0A4U5P8V9_STECR|nr:hypothetical protein L596_007276 [Steinernema carpocapsae]
MFAYLFRSDQILQQYRVNELHLLLGYFKAPKLGKKHELLQRCHSFLQNPRYQREFAQKIREINNSAGSQPRYSAYPQQQAYASRPSSGPSYGGGNMTGWAANQAQQQGGYRANDGQLQSMLGNPFALPGTSAFASSGGSTYRVKNLKPVKLPFFDLKDVVLELKELPGTANGMQQPSARLQFEFNVNPCILEGLVRNEGLPLPRRELQMRFFSADGNNTEQPDAFPPHCSVRIDGQAVVLPNVIPTNKPNVEPKRPSRPVNVTAYVSPHLNKHTISVEWSSDKRFWG